MRSSATPSSKIYPRAVDPAATGSSGLASRRGSALVIVVGTLALISVFAAIYISIGQSDRRSATTVTRRADLGAITNAHADNIAGIVARDRFDTVMQTIDERGEYQIPRRALTDAPYTDWTLRSESDDSWRLFSPVGGNGAAKPRRIAGDDPRVASDPWLASLRPTFLGDSFARPFSANLADRFYLDNRDWYQISNLAPDGRFVNLFNLRAGSPIGASTGGFDAEPGTGFTDFGNNRRIRRMSEGLSLYRLRQPNSEFSAIESFDPVAENAVWLPGVSDPVTPGATLPASEFLNTPAVFSMYQRFAFLPLNQPFVTYTSRTSNRPNEVATWRDPDFPAYQWADADADGMADSRWIELKSARIPANGSNPREDLTSLYDSSEFRVFAGVRVVDLSAMVNVNTATDSLTPPTEDYPLGITPAEIDLRRLLTMQDAAREYSFEYQDGGLQPLSMQDLHKPPRVARSGQRPGESDYRGYGHFLSALDAPLEAPLDPEAPGMLVGRYAAAGVRRGMDQYAPLGPAFRGTLDANPALENTLVEGSNFQRLGSALTASEFNTFADARAHSFARAGRLDPTQLGSSSLIPFFADSGLVDTSYYTSNPLSTNLYDTDDLTELLTYHGLNDPDSVSRLERNALGRYQGGERFSPLMSTRPLTLDRDRHGQVMPRGRLPYLELRNDGRNQDRVIDGRIAPESMAMFELSPRSVMTTLSGAVPLNPMGVAGPPVETRARSNPALAQSLSLSDASITLKEVVNSASNAVEVYGSTEDAFSVFYGALAGELEVFRTKKGVEVDGPPALILNRVWQADLSISRDSPYATLFYGHRGPELALRISAHAAVNTISLFGVKSGNPRVATLVLHSEFGDSDPFIELGRASRNLDGPLDVNSLGVEARRLAIYYPGLAGVADRLDLDGPRPGEVDDDDPRLQPADRRVLPGESQSPKPPAARQAVNVIGVQPTPVITEVASFYLYHDASDSVGGDSDYTVLPPPSGDPAQLTTTRITLNGSLDAGNSDLLAAVFAVQLHNPFDEDINLGGVGGGGIMGRKRGSSGFNAANNLVFDYYIEFNGHFFKLGEFWEYNPASTSSFTIDPTADEGGTPPAQDAPITSANPEYQYRDVTLAAGGTRVFYAMAHPRYDTNLSTGLDQRWRNAASGYGVPLFAEFTDLTNFDADADGLADGFDARGWTGIGQEWIENQFAVEGNRAVRMHPFNPRTGELVLENTFVDYNSTPGANPGIDVISETDGQIPGRVAEANQVRLWRKYVIPKFKDPSDPTVIIESEEGTEAGAAPPENFVENDILVDRLFLASAGGRYLDVGLPAGPNEVEDTVSLPESQQVTGPSCAPTGTIVRNDNSGVSITRWASVRRRDATAALTDATAFGRVLPWMIQSRLNPSSTWIRSTNKAGEPDAAPEAFSDTLTYDLFFDLCPDQPGARPERITTRVERRDDDFDIALDPQQLLNRGLRNRVYMNVKTMQTAPFDKLGPPSFLTARNRFPTRALGNNILPTVLDELHDGASPLRPEVVLRKNLNAARVADALLAMGIGPTWAPNLDSNGDGRIDPSDVYSFTDGEWMTLTEAFAVALGYEDIDLTLIPFPDQVDANIVWHDAVREYTDPGGGPARAEYVLDNLHLRLDDYVAFVNVAPPNLSGETGANGKPVFTIDTTSPVDAISDFRRGTGAPMALGVIDRLRPFGVLDLAGDPVTPPSDDTRPLTRAIPGLVNVQTAPLRVLRLLPGLTPSIEKYRPDEAFSTRQSEWWGAASGFAPNAGVAQLTTGVFEAHPDVAAGITAYRDRLAATPRNLSVDPGWALDERLIYLPELVLDNSPNAQWLTRNLQAEQSTSAIAFDRSRIAGVSGLRGSPMFGSLGELLMVATDEANPATPLNRKRHLTVQAYFGGGQQLGVDESGESVSIDPKFKSNDGSNPWSGVTPDDYAQRLALAAALSNTTTVRSDYFAAWMILQGFRESDVNGLRPEDPLVPSFKRRYLMVIDRSNVTEPGQAPRIVLFKELPL